MTVSKNLRLANFLKVGLDITLGLAILVIVGLSIWTAVSPLVLNRPDVFGTVTVPVRIGIGGDPKLDIRFVSKAPANVNEAYVEEAEGTFVFTTSDALPVGIANIAKLLILAGFAYTLNLLRSVMINLKAGQPFSEKNAVHIRRMGYAVLVLGVLGPVVQFLSALLIMSRLPETIPVLQAGPTFDGKVVLIALFILLLAQIWSYGIELEREQALTI
jgi:hypothetical protein